MGFSTFGLSDHVIKPSPPADHDEACSDLARHVAQHLRRFAFPRLDDPSEIAVAEIRLHGLADELLGLVEEVAELGLGNVPRGPEVGHVAGMDDNELRVAKLFDQRRGDQQRTNARLGAVDADNDDAHHSEPMRPIASKRRCCTSTFPARDRHGTDARRSSLDANQPPTPVHTMPGIGEFVVLLAVPS